MYLYGGRSSTNPSQQSDTWNNDFVSLSLVETFDIGSPTFDALPQPDGPPPVSNGYLWNSMSSLYVYGGEYSDKPATSPVPFSLWEYDISSSTWKEHEDPKISAGDNAEPAGASVQRSAEGAGFGVPELGRGWYFGGHLDGYTTAGWSQSIPRIYLRSLIEFTFPGYSNNAVESLAGDKKAGEQGVWRNITEGGLQEKAGFTERADGVLAYVPAFGKEGILLGLAGGTNESFTQMNVVDVYDIATSTWYKQATDGETPKIRVNPCAVVAAAADGSSFNVYLYGGQNLIPAGEQVQYDDIWILTVPSFTWVKVDTKGQSVPPGRSGHTCNIYDSQMVVVGGYVGNDLTCDSPGIYVFDLSQLKWQTQFTSLKSEDPQNRQLSQSKELSEGQLLGLSGSYGYEVPDAVQSVIGGRPEGAATVTEPVRTATDGPLATGKPPTYTVTENGALVTTTGVPGRTAAGEGGPNVGAIAAGVVAGVLAIVAGYFAFCAWVYRRQLTLYKNHVAMTQRQSADPQAAEKFGYTGVAGLPGSSGNSSGPPKSSADDSSGPGASSNGPYSSIPTQGGESGRISLTNSSTDDLMSDQEPSFLGVLLSPRRSLRVINRD
ncbi:MAG: hypothetical protein M1833_005257 [Piccolia ochrophora]|nr:MAG: hypothetical protein M1833_005257 [Piccolia ochrophora]